MGGPLCFNYRRYLQRVRSRPGLDRCFPSVDAKLQLLPGCLVPFYARSGMLRQIVIEVPCL